MEAQELITTLTDRIQRTANVKAIFGEPVTVDGNTIIAVGRLSLRGGGGGGKAKPNESWRGEAESNTGMGIGMNIAAIPVGYIKIAGGQAEFVPIIDRSRIRIGIIVVTGLAILTFGSIAKVVGITQMRRMKV